jgi:hypothetical protein
VKVEQSDWRRSTGNVRWASRAKQVRRATGKVVQPLPFRQSAGNVFLRARATPLERGL